MDFSPFLLRYTRCHLLLLKYERRSAKLSSLSIEIIQLEKYSFFLVKYAVVAELLKLYHFPQCKEYECNPEGMISVLVAIHVKNK